MSMANALMGNGVIFKLVEGNLADSKEDTIVNSTGDDINLGISVAKALSDKAGPELQKACSKLTPLGIGKVVVTPGFGIPCKQIVHCNSSWWKGKTQNKTELKQIICKCLEKAAEKNHQSIALPAVGMGVKGYSADVVAECTIAAVRQHSLQNPNSTLKLVKLYLYARTTTASQRQVFAQSVKMLEYKLSADGILMAGKIKVAVVKGNLPDVKADVITNSTGTQMSLSGGKVSLALLNKAGKSLQDECDKLAPLVSGKVVMTDGFGLPCHKVIHICCPSGWKTGTTEQILMKLISECLAMASDEGAKSIAFPVIGTGLLRYPPAQVAMCLFQAATEFSKKNPSSSLAKILLVVFITDTSTISGIESHFGATLKIHQNDAGGEDDGDGTEVDKPLTKFEKKLISDLPTFWEKPVNCYKEFVVNKNTPEFGDIERDFKKTLNLGNRQLHIIEARRIQNPHNYLLYDTARTNVAARLNKQEHEVETAPLWHGTREDNVDKIARTKFDRGLSGAVGANLLGSNCCYFSTTSQYSDGFAPRNSKGEKFMFLVRVVTGEYCKGSGTFKKPPYKNANATEEYDSVVDSKSAPTMFAVFHDASAYPEYVIKYKIVSSTSAPPKVVSSTSAPQSSSQKDDDDGCSLL